MKKLLTSIMLMFTLAVYSQENTVSKTISTISDKVDTLKKNVVETAKAVDTSSVSKQLYSDFKSGIIGIAGALKVGAEHVYVILIKQQVVKALTWLIIIITFLLSSIILWFLWYKDVKSREDWWGVPLVISIVFLIFFFYNINTIVTGFINPEFGALEQIMDWVKEHH